MSLFLALPPLPAVGVLNPPPSDLCSLSSGVVIPRGDTHGSGELLTLSGVSSGEDSAS